MRTFIYVDGFNLYYGALKNTAYKWLDLNNLFHRILPSYNEIRKIKYFTARIKNRPNNPAQANRQTIYLRALAAYSPNIDFHFGHFLSHPMRMPLANPTRTQQYCDVIKTEEKGSDVNLAVHILNDAWLDNYDCAVLVTNDSDFAEALNLIRQYFSAKKIGLITPGGNHPSKELAQKCHFQRRIRQGALANSQLPFRIPNTSISKPEIW